MITDYIYSFERQRFKKHWDFIIKKRDNLRYNKFNNAILLPPISSNKLFGDGGVYDENFKIIPESYLISGENNNILMGGGYSLSNLSIEQEIDDELIYLGYLGNHWGHFLVDFSTRLYFAKKHKNLKCVFLVKKDAYNFKPIKQISRFIQLLGLDIKKIIFLYKITRVRSLIIPEQSFQSGIFFSNEYIDLFDTVTKNISPSILNSPLKIYFSRSKFKKANNSEFGSEILDNLFKNNGYEIIYPEELSIDDQIFYINNCKYFAGISGTVLHNLLFLQKEICVICINKSNFINKMLIDTLKIRDIKPIFIDAYAMKYPVRLGFGPFLFVNNENLKKFIHDYNLKNISNHYNNSSFLRKCINSYLFQFQNIVFRERRILKIGEDITKIHYFSPHYINNWIEYYSQYELMDKYYYDIYNSLEDIVVYKDLKYTSCIDNIKHYFLDNLNDIYLYNIHISNIGWLKDTISNDICGFFNKDYAIEAFKILSLKGKNIFYKCSYDNIKWSKNYSNGEICGTIGKHKILKYISINSNNENILFRLYIKNNSWSRWYKNGEIAYSEIGFTALILKSQ